MTNAFFIKGKLLLKKGEGKKFWENLLTLKKSGYFKKSVCLCYRLEIFTKLASLAPKRLLPELSSGVNQQTTSKNVGPL